MIKEIFRIRLMFLGVLSFVVVAWGQPSGWPVLGILASSCGYALFWGAVRNYPRRFIASLIWFTAVQSIHLSWMTSIAYQGIYILIVYAALCIALGLVFSCFTLLIPKDKSITFTYGIVLASLWTLLEWGRMHLLCGFSWNPAGLALSSTISGLQMAALGGILGMSFWVILTNLLAIDFSQHIKTFIVCALFPYLFGFAHLAYHQKKQQQGSERLTVGLIQTGLLPSEKVPLAQDRQSFISPLNQWKGITSYLERYKDCEFDLLVLPEAVVPFGAAQPQFFLEDAAKILKQKLDCRTFPPLRYPFAEKLTVHGKEEWIVTNLFWAQAIADHFNTNLVVGLDAIEKETSRCYSAAFSLAAHSSELLRYEKRILVPLAEYLPFEWLRKWTAAYGITDFFSHGKEAKVFGSKCPYSISICYEETFPDVMREGRLKGARLFVNITNDSWYPFSKLPQQHFDHGRIRAVENGVPLVRACNTGITGAVDGLGKKIAVFENDNKKFEFLKGVLAIPLKVYTYPTLYTWWGDKGILTLCIVSFLLYIASVLALKLRLR